MLGRIGAVREPPGALEDEIHAERLPRQLRRILLGQHLELTPVDRDAVALGRDVRLEVAEDGVVLQQVGQRGRAGEVVDGDDLDVRAGGALERIELLRQEGIEIDPSGIGDAARVPLDDLLDAAACAWTAAKPAPTPLPDPPSSSNIKHVVVVVQVSQQV